MRPGFSFLSAEFLFGLQREQLVQVIQILAKADGDEYQAGAVSSIKTAIYCHLSVWQAQPTGSGGGDRSLGWLQKLYSSDRG